MPSRFSASSSSPGETTPRIHGSGPRGDGAGSWTPPERDGRDGDQGGGSGAKTALKVLLYVIGGLLGLVVAVLIGVALALQTDWGRGKVKELALDRINARFDGAEARIGRLEGSILSGLTLYDFELVKPDGEPLARVDTLRADYRLLPLVQRELRMTELYIGGPQVWMEQRADTTWDLLSVWVPDTATTGNSFLVDLENMTLNRGAVEAAFYTASGDSVVQVRDLNVALGRLVFDAGITFELDTLTARVLPPDPFDGPVRIAAGGAFNEGALTLTGLRLESPRSDVVGRGALALPSADNAWGRNLDFALRAEPLAFRDIHPFMPALDPTGTATLALVVRGGDDRIRANLEAALSDGGRIDLEAAFSPPDAERALYAVEGEIRDFDPAFLTGNPQLEGPVNAEFTVDLAGPSLQQADGRVEVRLYDSELGTYDLARTTLQAAFTDGEAALDLETGLQGMTLTAEGTARPFAPTPTYDLEGRIVDLDIGRFTEGEAQQSAITASYSLEGRGFAPDSADLTLRLDLAPSTVNDLALEDGRLALNLAGGELTFDTALELPEGALTAEGTADLGGDAVRYQVTQGEIRGFDLASFRGDTVQSRLNGTFTLSGVGTDPQAMRLDAQVDLADSFYGAYTIDDAEVAARLRNGALALDADADLGDGGEIAFTATGSPFAETPTFRVRDGRFQNLDVGALTGNPTQSSDLTGTFTLDARGLDPQTMTLDTNVRLEASRFNDQEIAGADVQARLRGGELAYDARLDLPEGGSLALSGTGNPFDDQPAFALREGRFSGLNLGALLGNPNLTTDLNGTATIDSRGSDPQAMTLDATLRLDASTIAGAEIEGGVVEADIDGGLARIDARLDLPEGEMIVDATADLSGERPVYDVSGVVEGLAVAREDAAPAQVSFAFDIEGVGLDPQTMEAQGSVRARQTTFADVRLDTLGTRFRIDDGVLAVDTLRLASNVADATAGGRLALFDTTGAQTSDFRVNAEITSLEPVRGLIEAEVFGLSSGTLEARVVGPSDALRVEGTTTINSLLYNTTRLAGLEAGFNLMLGPERSLTRAELEADLTYLSRGPLTIRQTTVETAYDGTEASFVLETLVDERRDARFAGTIEWLEGGERFRIEELGMRFDDDRWALDGPAVIDHSNGYTFTGFALASGDQEVVIDGRINPDSLQDFHVRIENLRMGGFADLAGFPTLGGTLDTRLDLTGPAEEPRLDAVVGFDVRHRNAQTGTLEMTLEIAENRLQLEAALAHEAGGPLTLTGFLPFDFSMEPLHPEAPESEEGIDVDIEAERAEADFRMQADAFALAFFEPFFDPATVSDLQGALEADIRIGGTRTAPALDGRFALEGARIGMPRLGLAYDQIDLAGLLESNNVLIERAEVVSGDGSLTARGRIEMPELTLGEFALDLTLDDFHAVENAQFDITASGALAIGGTTDAPVVEGDLSVRNTNVYLVDAAGGDIRPVDLTEEDVRMLQVYFGYDVAERDTAESAVYAATTLDLEIELNPDTWVRQTSNPEIAIELTGELEVAKEPNGELLIFRSITANPRRSYIRQFGRRFDIRTGEIRFNGPVEELVMDIGAEYVVPSRGNPGQPEATIMLSLEGRLDDLEFALSSDPMMDNTDIVSYLATGRPAGEVLDFDGGGGGILGTGGGLAANQLAGFIESQAADGLGLDVIEIQQDGLRGTQLVAGKYVDPVVYVGINQPIALGSTDNATAGVKPTEVTVEYEMFDWLLLQALSGTSSASVRLNLMGKHTF